MADGPGRDWVRALHRVEDALLVAGLGGMILLASAQIVLRNLFQSGFAWGDPVLRVLVLWLALLGALAAGRDDRHITIDFLPRALPPRARVAVRGLTHGFTAAVSAVVAFHAGRFVFEDLTAGIPGIGAVPAWVLEVILPVGFAVLTVRYAVRAAGCLRAAARGDRR